MAYLVMVAVVFGINLLPAFGPPTWSVLATYRLTSHLNGVALVVLGAGAAASGRLVLALATRRLRPRLGGKRLKNLQAASSYLTASRRRSVVGLVLFALSPIPSAQLFEAAGLLDVRLGPALGVFFAGRLVSYSLYVGGASALRGTALGDVTAGLLTGGWGIAAQVVLLLGVAALVQINLGKLIQRWERSRRRSPSR
ncbi:MAG TPA: hypothetical protein VFW71_15760 [Actinomycetota bacterium]|nr:hypothetical protein [Actinomycetota bacterium]